MESVKRKKSKMPRIFGGNGENVKRKAVQSMYSNDGTTTEQSLFTFEVGNSYSKRSTGTPIKTLLAKEMSNEISAKKRSPSLIAKLMGLEGLPSPQPIHRQQRKLSENSHKRSASLVGQSNEKSTLEQQPFKDVYEDPEASHVANQRYPSQLCAKRRVTRKESGYIREKCDEALRESYGIQSTLERVDSNSDLILSFLEQPDSLFVKHLHDQPCNHITLLKPSNSARHWVHGKSFKEERDTSKYHDPVSHQRHEDEFLGHSSRSANNSYRSSGVQQERKEAIAVSPTRIVVLKPNITKIYNDMSNVLSPNDRRKNAEGSGDGGYRRYKGSLGEVRSSRHKSREAREIAREITSRMKEGFESGHANLCDSGFRGYVSASESEATMEPSRNSFDRNDRPKPPPSRMSESSVIREAKKKMSERWKMTHGYKDTGMVVNRGSTLGEMLSVPDMPLGISSSSRDGWRDGYLRNTSRSRSVPPSFRNRNHRTTHEALADEKLLVYSEPHNRGRSKGVKGNEYLLSKNLRYNNKCHCSPEFSTFLPESRSCQKPTVGFQNEDHFEQPRLSDIHNATINAATVVDVINKSSELSPKLATSMLGDADSSAVDEDGSNIQEPSTVQSGGSNSMQLSGPEPESSESSKEVDQRGQTSVPEIPLTEDVSSGSDCFETVNSQLHELRKQLQLLKMESGYNGLPLTPNEEEAEQASDPDNWESAYLADILHGSGFPENDPYTFMATWHSVDPWLFDNLEKKYSGVSRSDRRMLYDRVKEAIFVISKTRVSRPWVKRGVQMTLSETGLEDQLRKELGKQEREATETFEEMSIDKDRDWFQPVKEVDVVVRQITELLVSDLVLEVVSVQNRIMNHG